MAALTANIVYRSGSKGEGLRYVVGEVKSATSADTWTIDEFTADKDTVCFQLDTGDALACTEATNVVTVGGAVTTVPIVIYATGY